MGSPVQKGPIGLLDNAFLSLSNLVPLLCVWNGPGLLNLAQFFKAIIESLATKQVGRRDQETKAFASVPTAATTTAAVAVAASGGENLDSP